MNLIVSVRDEVWELENVGEWGVDSNDYKTMNVFSEEGTLYAQFAVWDCAIEVDEADHPADHQKAYLSW